MNPLDLLTGNNSDAQSKFAEQQRQLAGTYNPIIDTGNQARGTLLDSFNKLNGTPDFLQNQLSANWKPSQYMQAQQKFLTQAMNNNAAATGQLGSSYSARQFGDTMQDILSKDQNIFIDRGVNAYNTSLNGLGGLNSQGYDALNQQNNIMTGANKAQMEQEQANSQALTQLMGQGASLAGNFFTGGATGAGGLIGGLGRQAMPGFTSKFQTPATTFNGAGSLNYGR